jgi:hypothetical protein
MVFAFLSGVRPFVSKYFPASFVPACWPSSSSGRQSPQQTADSSSSKQQHNMFVIKRNGQKEQVSRRYTHAPDH